MKNVKKQDKTLFALCIGVVFMLIVTAVMSFAYFTARAESETQAIQFGVLELDVIDGFELKNEENQNVKIVPGCTIKMAGTIKLTDTSNVDAFVRMKPMVTVEKDGKTATDVSADTFVELFNSALSSDNGSWKTPETTDGYIYFAGKFSNSNTGTNIVKSFNLSSASFELDATKFGNVWQGVTVSIGLTVQALQSAHVGVDNVADTTTYPTTQSLVNAIASIEAWEDEFRVFKLDNMYKKSWDYTRGTFSQPMQKNAQMLGYGVFTENNSGEYIQFGWYPQTIKADSVTITAQKMKWAGFDCYVGTDSCLYVEVVNPTPCNGGTDRLYSNGTACSKIDEPLYFKLERIVWQILNDERGNKLLYSVKILTHMKYFQNLNIREISGKEIHPNNYKYSDIRAYLNGLERYMAKNSTNSECVITEEYKNAGFLQQSFTSKQLNLIKLTTVDNSKETILDENACACEDTQDKIFLLSQKDLQQYSYGNDGNVGYRDKIKNGSDNETRIKTPTDYAGAMGAIISNTAGEIYAGKYCGRSPASSKYGQTHAYGLNAGGVDSTWFVQHPELYGVVPALYLNI